MRFIFGKDFYDFGDTCIIRQKFPFADDVINLVDSVVTNNTKTAIIYSSKNNKWNNHIREIIEIDKKNYLLLGLASIKIINRREPYAALLEPVDEFN